MPPMDGLRGHRAQRLDVVRQQQRGRTGPRAASVASGAGVAAADNDDDVETGGELYDPGWEKTRAQSYAPPGKLSVSHETTRPRCFMKHQPVSNPT